MDDLISQFMDITGVDRERAEFYLGSSAWQLEVALANFYECAESGPPAEESSDVINTIEEFPDQQPPESTRPEQRPEKILMDKPKIKSKSRDKPRFGTLASLQSRESSSDEEGQTFYAGGSEHSGQQVVGPSKRKNDIASDMIKTCREQSIPVDERSSSQQQRPSTFSGTGYKLGQTSSDTQVIEASSLSTQASNSGVIKLKLWRDGFTINDQEIRLYRDPQNEEFMEAIKRAEIPMELRQEVQGAEVRLDMEDHRHEEYVAPKNKVKVFTGRGHKLGSPSPATVGMTVPTDDLADEAANESRARSQLNLDTSNPVTMIQIRLANGQSIREQFNLTHTIGDIRRFITTMRPQYAIQGFSLLTSYPTTELTDENKTIDEAGLKNCALMQRQK
ncbi:hypothetical protein PV325_007876 [Microctonus aethiopoides]|nr:hypothetical protein PV325_007876 [Microctonus aethiopoides]